VDTVYILLITLRVSRRRREMYIVCVCVSACLSAAAFPVPTLLQGPGRNLGNGRGCPLVVHYWADLQSVALLSQHSANAKCQRVLVLALCLVLYVNARKSAN